MMEPTFSSPAACDAAAIMCHLTGATANKHAPASCDQVTEAILLPGLCPAGVLGTIACVLASQPPTAAGRA
jgi:hypothetical protein